MKKRCLPAGPPQSPLAGSLREYNQHRLEFLSACGRQFGDICTFRLGLSRVFLVNHPELIHRVMVSQADHFIKGHATRIFKPLLGEGIATSEGETWRRQRRMLQPAFQHEPLAAYSSSIVNLTEQMLKERWHAGARVQLCSEFSRLASAIGMKTLFGIDKGPDREEYITVLRSVFGVLNARSSSILPQPYWLPSPTNARLRRALKKLHSIVDSIIRQRQSATEPGDDLLYRLIHDACPSGQITEQELRDQVITLFLAGHEATALALTWACYTICQHPQVEERLVSEWTTALAGRNPTHQDIPNLPLTDQVVRESIRLYPPSYVMSRQAITNVEVGGFVVRRGETVFISQWVTQRDPRFFPDPLVFRPERWADEQADSIPRYAYLPFGAGPRICIGNKFALQEATLVLATIGQQFRWAIDEKHPIEISAAASLYPTSGLPLLLEPR